MNTKWLSDYSPNFINLLRNLLKGPFFKIFTANNDQCTESLVNHDFFSFCCWFSSNKIKLRYFIAILLCVGKGIQEGDFILKGHTAYDVMICELFIWNLTKNIGKFQWNLWKYHDDSPYLRKLKLHADTKVDKQTVMFFYIQALLLPLDEAREVLQCFFISHPF